MHAQRTEEIFHFSPLWRAWHAWLSRELLIPNLFVQGDIDWSPVVYRKCSSASSNVGHGGFCLLFNSEPSERLRQLWFWSLYLLFPRMSLLRTSCTESDCRGGHAGQGSFPPRSAGYLRNPMEVQLAAAGKGGRSFETHSTAVLSGFAFLMDLFVCAFALAKSVRGDS